MNFQSFCQILGIMSRSTLQERLKLLYLVSDLAASSWRLMPDFRMNNSQACSSSSWPVETARVFASVDVEAVREMLAPRVANLPLVQAVAWKPWSR